jgi:hypothetical protein
VIVESSGLVIGVVVMRAADEVVAMLLGIVPVPVARTSQL